MPLDPTPFHTVLSHYRKAFADKVHLRRLGRPDVLMQAFGLTPQVKAEAVQYWSRELGMCWEKLVREAYRAGACDPVGPALRKGAATPCDFTVSEQAVDTKYRLGSGDAGTLGKLAGNAAWLIAQGYRPLMLLLRDDSLPQATTRMRRAGWTVLEGEQALGHVRAQTGCDLGEYLAAQACPG